MSDAPTILGMDIATNAATAYGRVGEKPSFSRYCLDGDPDFMGVIHAVAKAQIWMIDLLTTLRPDYVVIEAPLEFVPPGRGAAATIRLSALAAAIGAVAQNKQYPVRLARVNAVRAAFLGPGCGQLPGQFAKKEVSRFCKAAGWEPNTDDESDAGAVWWWLGRELRPRLAQPMDPLSLGIAPVQKPVKGERWRVAPKRFGSAA